MIYYFDIETNAISNFATLEGLEVVFVLVAIDSDGNVHKATTDKQIKELLEKMSEADAVVGHNIIGFDLPVLHKLYNFSHKHVYDTVVMSRCIYPDIRDSDFNRKEFPKPLIGSHSLKAWGYRLGVQKDAHGETESWEKLTPEMVSYCEQDVIVTKALADHLWSKEPSPQMIQLEHDFAKIIRKQEFNGFPFDNKKAEALCSKLTAERVQLKQELQEVFEPEVVEMKSFWYVDKAGNKYQSKKAALEAGVKDPQKGPHKTKQIPFNPNSRDQIAERLMNLGWKPEAYEGKRPKIDETVLRGIGKPEADKLCKYLLLTKRLGQISEGNQAWLKMSREGAIHGSVITNGAVSGRCTHRNPNVAQVPAVRAEYGHECRELFHAPKQTVLVGADASGLELRCLAHYLHRFDNGAYGKEILEGDIHTANQNAAGLNTRDQAKTFIYAFLYGAGDAKIGSIVSGSNAQGRRLKQSFMQKTPAIKKLLQAVNNKVKISRSLKGLDGRILPCRSAHSALNLLLQSAGAVVMKQALVEFVYLAKKPYNLHANVHDEIQFSCDAQHAEELGETFQKAMRAAGDKLNFRCQLDSEYKIGSNWAETH